MANHLHKQIRDAVKTALTGLTTSAARVYANRLQPMADTNLPGLRIYLDDEDAQGLTIHNPQALERRLSLSVECCAKAVTGLDDTLDQMSKEVEVVLAAGITVGTRSVECFYTGMNFDDELADKPFGVKRLTFSIPFVAMNNAPDTMI